MVPGAGRVSSGDGIETGASNEGDCVEFSAMHGPWREIRQSTEREQIQQIIFTTLPQFRYGDAPSFTLHQQKPIHVLRKG
jgi:hypothetical protein